METYSSDSGYPLGGRPASSYTYDTRPTSNFTFGNGPQSGFTFNSKPTSHGENFALNARVNFVKKVFSIVTAQLITTAVFIFFSAYSKHYIRFVEHSPFITFLAATGTIVTSLILIFWRSLARSSPNNYYILGIFTLCESYLVSSITSQYDPSAIFGAVFLTAAIVCSLTLYACTTKHEITYFMGLIAMLSMGSFFFFFVKIFIRSSFINLASTFIGSILAGLYLIYDIKAIMGNHGTFRVDIDDYVGGALNLYIDIIQIFLKVLHFLGEKDEEKNKKRR